MKALATLHKNLVALLRSHYQSVFKRRRYVVFDPFCGCATTLVAADRLQREWIGVDLSAKAAELVVERIRDDQGIV